MFEFGSGRLRFKVRIPAKELFREQLDWNRLRHLITKEGLLRKSTKHLHRLFDETDDGVTKFSCRFRGRARRQTAVKPDHVQHPFA